MTMINLISIMELLIIQEPSFIFESAKNILHAEGYQVTVIQNTKAVAQQNITSKHSPKTLDVLGFIRYVRANYTARQPIFVMLGNQ